MLELYGLNFIFSNLVCLEQSFIPIEILPYISNLLFMTVIPGKGGQKLIQEVLPKIKNISEIVQKEGYGLQISVDRRS